VRADKDIPPLPENDSTVYTRAHASERAREKRRKNVFFCFSRRDVFLSTHLFFFFFLSPPPPPLSLDPKSQNQLQFHVAKQKFYDATLSPYQTIDTGLPGAKLKILPAGGGLEIAPASYSGRRVGPAGPGEFYEG